MEVVLINAQLKFIIINKIQKMKKLLLVLLGISMSCFLIAQETVKQKEIGLIFNDFNNFGMAFKVGTNKSMWRFNTLMLSGNQMNYKRDSVTDWRNDISFDIRVGKEFRKNIVDNFDFRYGTDLLFRYATSQYVNSAAQKRIIYNFGVNLVFGFDYVINDKIVLGAEMLPSFVYSKGVTVEKRYVNNKLEEIESDISGFNYGLSNTSVLLYVAYRF